MKRIELIFLALIAIFSSFSFAFGEETADDLGQGLTVPTCGRIYASETHMLNSAIGSNATSVSFILSWGETAGDLDMVLVTPSGMKIDPEAKEPISYQRNASLIYYIVPYPEPGNWTAEITARDVPEAGEDYCAFTVLDEDEAAMEDEGQSESPSDPSDEVQDSDECAECNSW
jgi:hypothetical protein